MTQPDACAMGMHPLDAIAAIMALGDAPTLTDDQRVELDAATATASGMPEWEWRRWVARALGVTPATIKVYDPDRERYDIAGPSHIYRYYDADDRLLYVGITVDPNKRDDEHRSTAPWFAQAVRRTVIWHPDRASALAAERAAIRDEHPIHNRAGRR